MLILLLPQGAAPPPINVGEVILDLIPSLGAYQADNLVAWTTTELYEFADEGAKRFAVRIGGFVEHNDDESVVNGTASYTLPTRHLSTIYLAVGDTTLYPTTRQALEALDATWTATSEETPTRFLQDEQTKVRIYPTPNADSSGAIGIIHHQYPTDVTAAAPSVTAPSVLSEYLAWYMLSEARGKESDLAMPEVSKFFAGLVGLFEDIAGEYWGKAQ